MNNKHAEGPQDCNSRQTTKIIVTGVLLAYVAYPILAFTLPLDVLVSPVFRSLSGVVLQMIGSGYVGWRLKVTALVHYVAFAATSLVLIHIVTLLGLYRSVTLNDVIWALAECSVGGTGIFLGGWMRRRVCSNATTRC